MVCNAHPTCSTRQAGGRYRQSRRCGKSFLDVLLVIVFILIAIVLLLPLFNRPRTPGGYWSKQRAQFSSIDTAIELYNSEFNMYPPSDSLDEAGIAYCGAMKLCEAVMGQDLLGFHPNSVFRCDGTDGKGNVLYPDRDTLSEAAYDANMRMRKGPYLPLDNANAYRLADLYGADNTGPFDPNHFVLCDRYRRIKHRGTGIRVGTLILYYKADTSKTAHDVNDPKNPDNIYDYKDNHALLALGVPGKPGVKHPLYEDPKIFYEITKNYRIKTQSKPYRADTYILISAGWDGLFGTEDDITNFEWKWKRE